MVRASGCSRPARCRTAAGGVRTEPVNRADRPTPLARARRRRRPARSTVPRRPSDATCSTYLDAARPLGATSSRARSTTSTPTRRSRTIPARTPPTSCWRCRCGSRSTPAATSWSRRGTAAGSLDDELAQIATLIWGRLPDPLGAAVGVHPARGLHARRRAAGPARRRARRRRGRRLGRRRTDRAAPRRRSTDAGRRPTVLGHARPTGSTSWRPSSKSAVDELRTATGSPRRSPTHRPRGHHHRARSHQGDRARAPSTARLAAELRRRYDDAATRADALAALVRTLPVADRRADRRSPMPVDRGARPAAGAAGRDHRAGPVAIARAPSSTRYAARARRGRRRARRRARRTTAHRSASATISAVCSARTATRAGAIRASPRTRSCTTALPRRARRALVGAVRPARRARGSSRSTNTRCASAPARRPQPLRPSRTAVPSEGDRS